MEHGGAGATSSINGITKLICWWWRWWSQMLVSWMQVELVVVEGGANGTQAGVAGTANTGGGGGGGKIT